MLPLAWTRKVGAAGGRFVELLAPGSRAVAARGLATVGAERYVGAHFGDLGRRFVEFARLESSLRAELVRVEPAQVEALRAAALGKGALVLTAPFGHWERLGAALARAGL